MERRGRRACAKDGAVSLARRWHGQANASESAAVCGAHFCGWPMVVFMCMMGNKVSAMMTYAHKRRISGQ